MLRGSLDAAVRTELYSQLPDIQDLVRQAPSYGLLDWNSMKFGDQPDIPIAGVCLQDAISILSASHFATFEALAHQRWAQLHATDVSSSTDYQVWYGRFFADDAALRLYAVGEHLAAAIVYLLNISSADLKAFKENTKVPLSSYQMQVGFYLQDQFPGHAITQAITKLAASNEWKWTKKYRDLWVHKQPPLMDGFGIQFERKARWQNVQGASTPQRVMGIGLRGDEPQYTVDELIANVRGALFAITETTMVVAEQFAQVINAKN